MYSVINLEVSDFIATITVNRPDKLNALNSAFFTELDHAVNEIAVNSNVRCLVITGAGEKAFAAGADISELQACNASTGAEFARIGQRVFSKLEALPFPVIAAVNGFALGGGCELAMACHIRFASETAKFGQPEVNLGIIPGYGGTQRLAKLVGHSKALELIVSAEIIDAHQALNVGLVNRVYPKQELLAETYNFAKNIVSKAPLAVRGCVEAITTTSNGTDEQGMSTEAQIFGRICGTEDFKEGTTAFMQKRSAVFTGK